MESETTSNHRGSKKTYPRKKSLENQRIKKHFHWPEFAKGLILGSIVFGFAIAVVLYRANTDYDNLVYNNELLQDTIKVDEGILQLFFENAYNRDGIQLTEVTVSAYSSTRDQTDNTPYQNASGGNTFVGQVAVSRDLINGGLKFGDTVYLEGIGLFKVQDVMAPRWKNRVDIWCASKEACKLFGLKERVTMIWIQR